MLNKFANRRVIGILGMLLATVFFCLGLYLFVLGEILAPFGFLITIIAFAYFLLMILFAFVAFYRYYEIRNDVVSCVSGGFAVVLDFFMIFGLQVFLNYRNNYKLLPSYRLFQLDFIINLFFFVWSYLIFLESIGKWRMPLFLQGNEKLISHTTFKIKIGNLILISLLLIASGFGVYTLYPRIMNLTDIDLVSGISIDFAGVDGAGYIENVDNEISYDHDNEKLSKFIHSLELNYDDSNSLSNGDIVRVNVLYSRTQAKALKLHITSSYRNIKVTGLSQTYKKRSDLSASLISKLISDADQRIKIVYKDHLNEYQIKQSALYLAKSKNAANKSLVIVLHKIIKNPKETDKEKLKIEYRATFFRDFNDSYDTIEEPYWYSHKLLRISLDPCVTMEQAVRSMKDKFGDYTYIRLE